MPSVKILLYTHKTNSDGTHPIVIQVIDGKPKKRTLANVRTDQWDEATERVIKKSHDNYAAINIKISNEYNRVEKLILKNEFNMRRDFIDYFDNLKNDHEVTENKIKSFSEIVPLYISSLKSGQSMLSYESRLKYFISEAGIGDLPISGIERRHINTFIRKMDAKGNQQSTLRTQLKIVRYCSSFAAREGYDTKPDALHNFKLPKAGRSLKTKLNKKEFEAFKNAEIANPKLKEMRDVFLFCVYLRGMRIGDALQLKQEYFRNGRLIYESGKNKKQFNIKLVPEALTIYNRYKDGREYLFTFFNWEYDKTISAEENLINSATHIKSITAYINAQLKFIAEKAGIDKTISTHIARHTFSKMAIDKIKDLNISMDLVGHSNLKEHELYIREISQEEELDEATDSIFGD